jgi:hypothetical protein
MVPLSRRPVERRRIISKEGRRWRVVHSDNAVTYHKTLKAAKKYEHTIYVLHPFSNLYIGYNELTEDDSEVVKDV